MNRMIEMSERSKEEKATCNEEKWKMHAILTKEKKRFRNSSATVLDFKN